METEKISPERAATLFAKMRKGAEVIAAENNPPDGESTDKSKKKKGEEGYRDVQMKKALHFHLHPRGRL